VKEIEKVEKERKDEKIKGIENNGDREEKG